MHCIWNTSGGERKITIYFVKKIICYNFGTSYYNCGLGLVYYVLFFFFIGSILKHQLQQIFLPWCAVLYWCISNLTFDLI